MTSSLGTTNTLHQPIKTIYFDVSTLNPDRVTGIGVYILQLWKYLKNRPEIKVIPVLKASRFKKKPILEKFIDGKIQLIWPWTGLGQKNALYHGPDFKLLMNPFISRIVTVHDMVVFEKAYNTASFYEKGIADLTKVLSSKLEAVVVNSQFTKDEVLRYFPSLASKTYVTYLGCDRSYPTPQKDIPSLPSKYVLFLGTLEKRKNVTTVLEAFKILCEKGFPHHLVLAGTWGFGEAEIKQALANFPYKDKVVHLNYVPDNQVKSLFSNATAFVFPSLYEGFGIPVLESMQLNCPVVTSNEGVLKEITGDAALHASPTSPQEIAAQTVRLIESNELREQLIQKGRAQSSQFVWEKCAHETLQIYLKV